MKLSEEQIFNAMSRDNKVYDAATPEEKAIYDSIMERRRKKVVPPTGSAGSAVTGKTPDTVPVTTEAGSLGATAMKKEPTAAELISQSINSFSESIVGALGGRRGL